MLSAVVQKGGRYSNGGTDDKETTMTEFFEDKGTWAGLPVTVQGIFEEGECIAVKVLGRCCCGCITRKRYAHRRTSKFKYP